MNKALIKELIFYARKSIESGFNNSVFKPSSVPKELEEKHGVFVTLTINDCLRGCIGIINPVPLWTGVINAARNSAFNDPRFPELTLNEFNKVIIEISILSVPKKTSLSNIMKSDGVILEYKSRSALFLPQVWKQLPKKNEFLTELSLKAGLKPDDYKKANFMKFSVKAYKEVFPNGEIKTV